MKFQTGNSKHISFFFGNEEQNGWTYINKIYPSRDGFSLLGISESGFHGATYSEDVRTSGRTDLVSGSLSAVLSNLTMQTEWMDVLCCQDGVVSPTTCGYGVSCETICGQSIEGNVRIVNTESVTESQYCFPSNLRNPFTIPIYQLSYCPGRVRTVSDLRRYPVCCFHPAVWRNVDGVKDKCCSEYSFCDFEVSPTTPIPQISYSQDLSTGLVSGSLFPVLGNLITRTVEMDVLCCVDGYTQSQTCGNGVSCDDVCSYGNRAVRIVNTEFVTQSQFCFPSDIEVSSRFESTIYLIYYCPWKVETVSDLAWYPVCCLHLAVWRNVDGVKEKCCSEYGFCP